MQVLTATTSRYKVEMSKKQTKKQDQAAAMPLSQIIKKINKENAPPGGWRPENKKALKDGAYKRWKKLLKQKQQASSFKRQAPAGLNLNTIKRYK